MPNDDDTNDTRLPALVEGVLGLFESHMGYEITFRCVTRNQTAPCLLCSSSTKNRLETYKSNEMLTTITACRACLKGAGESVSHHE